MTVLSQITIWQNPLTGEITAEVPQNGSRKKISLNENDPQSWGQIIKSELDAASAWERKIQDREWELKMAAARYKAENDARVEDKKWAQHHRNYDNVRDAHGRQLAEEAIGPRNRNSKKKIPTFNTLIIRAAR